MQTAKFRSNVQNNLLQKCRNYEDIVSVSELDIRTANLEYHGFPRKYPVELGNSNVKFEHDNSLTATEAAMQHMEKIQSQRKEKADKLHRFQKEIQQRIKYRFQKYQEAVPPATLTTKRDVSSEHSNSSLFRKHNRITSKTLVPLPDQIIIPTKRKEVKKKTVVRKSRDSVVVVKHEKNTASPTESDHISNFKVDRHECDVHAHVEQRGHIVQKKESPHGSRCCGDIHSGQQRTENASDAHNKHSNDFIVRLESPTVSSPREEQFQFQFANQPHSNCSEEESAATGFDGTVKFDMRSNDIFILQQESLSTPLPRDATGVRTHLLSHKKQCVEQVTPATWEASRKQRRYQQDMRMMEGLKQQFTKDVEAKNLEIPPLCNCCHTTWDEYVVNCCNNCAFYQNPRAFAEAMVQAMSSIVKL